MGLGQNVQRPTFNVQRSIEEKRSKGKARAAFAARALIFTPPVPFRWISRSLSVTGG